MTYSQTDDGLVECCGQKDCDEKACGSYTSVKLPDGSTQVCCGKNDCEQKALNNTRKDFELSVNTKSEQYLLDAWSENQELFGAILENK